MGCIGYLHTDIFCERVKPAEQTKLVIRIPARHRTDISVSKLPTKTIPTPVLLPLLIPEKVFQRVATYLWEMMNAEKNSGFYPGLNSMSWADTKREFLAQLRGFFRGIAPYNSYRGEPPRVWWNDRKDEPKWQCIAVRSCSISLNVTHKTVSILQASFSLLCRTPWLRSEQSQHSLG